MKPGIPWSVKGIEPELREIAKTAAKRSGMTLGEWLNSAINEQAVAPAPATTEVTRPAARSRISTHPIDRAATRLEDIAEQLSRLALREGETTQHYKMPPAQEAEALSKILNRVDSNERQTVEAFTAINERLTTMSRQVSQSVKAQPRPEDAPGFQALEKAVRNIVEHLEVSEKRTRDNLKSLQDRMGDMSIRASGTGQNAPAFSQLENRLSELARRVDQGQGQSVQGLPDLLRNELDDLAGRIETVRETAEVLASKAQTQAVQASQAELRTIEQRILGLLREAQTSFASNSSTPAEIQKFRNSIEKLNVRIDEAARGAASNRDLTTLRVAVEQLSTRVAQGPDTRPLADMDRRILDITKRLEQTQTEAQNMPQFGELERRMAELDHRLNDAIRQQDNGKANVALEQKLAEVNDRLGRTEHQLSHFETIEKAISQLYDAMEKNRTWTQEVADDAAQRMGQHIMSQPQAVASVASLAGSPEIQALEKGLHAVREASQLTDSRNQETLEAVHETLEQIVAKLAELETAAIGQRIAQVAAPTAAAVQQAVHDTATNAPAAVADPFAFHAEPAPAPISASAPEPVNVFAEAPIAQAAINPFDPAPTSAEPGNPFDAVVMASRLAEVPAGNTQDYIAAARRMSQASQQRSILAGISPGAAELSEKHSKKLLSLRLPFSRGAKEKLTPPVMTSDLRLPPEIKPANITGTGNRPKLILMGLVVLALVSGVMVKSFFSGPANTMLEPTPIVIEQSVTPAPAVDTNAAQPTPESKTTTPAAAPLDKTSLAPDSEAPKDSSAMVSGSDDILTGSLSAAMNAAPASTDNVVLEEAIGTSKLREAASIGDPNAQFVIATRYLNGENVTIDYAKAAYWYGRAAASGLAPAQYRVATLYERGKGVPKDMKAALSWYERAGSLGNVKAMHNAAVISAGNEAGSPDYTRAYKWFSLAASHGLKDSEFNLAILIERGLGTKADPVEAMFWYSAAAAQQDMDAQSHVDTLTKTLSPATVEDVKARLRNWVPERAPEAANVVAINDDTWKGGEQKQQQSLLENSNPVSTAQDLLGKLGFNIGQADGKMGGRTANAIRLFQLQEGLKVTGQVTPELIATMQSKAT
jgi:localization factor PodJL